MRRTASHENDIIRTGGTPSRPGVSRENRASTSAKFALDVPAVAHRVLGLDREANIGVLLQSGGEQALQGEQLGALGVVGVFEVVPGAVAVVVLAELIDIPADSDPEPWEVRSILRS